MGEGVPTRLFRRLADLLAQPRLFLGRFGILPQAQMPQKQGVDNDA